MPANQRRLYLQSSSQSPDRGTQEKKRKRSKCMSGKDRRSTDQATRGEKNKETVARAEKEDETG
jgi:hypothetical protein